MPYSPSHHYVHVAIPKTGTTSVVRALHQLHALEGGELGLIQEAITPEFRSRHGLEALGDKHPKRAKHLSALQLRSILGDEAYGRAFSFSIVRNPWARLASRYRFTHVDNEPSLERKLQKGTGRRFHDLSFAEWIHRRHRRWKRKGRVERGSQMHKIVDADGKVMVDYVGRLETLQDSFDEICDRIGVERREVPHVNGTNRGGQHYSAYYDRRTREMVGEMCQLEIEAFGYRFEAR